ncbi:putative iron-sulfur cluster assembly scaffold protein for SUF system, SufE2 [Lachnospiraceae bacterium KM106-2]|nr:putative iron-sulfur cluster assembly scaffold protein for SUF system, SufE2 [Lachnospiraceae bacterium KM106-2]
MSNRTFYNEILIDHNSHPYHKKVLEDADIVLEGVNPSCGDDIWLQLKVKEDKIEDAAFYGSGCAISQASADLMIDLILGRSKSEALTYIELFYDMIQGKLTEEEMEQLEEASCLRDISHMPARVKCAVLSWHTLETMIQN